MIASIVRASWLNLRRDRAAWVLSFVLPIAFFSIFAIIFGQQRKQGIPRVGVAVVDEDRTEISARLVDGLLREKGLRAATAPAAKDGAPSPATYDRASSEAAVRTGDVPVALIIPRGFGAAPLALGRRHAESALLLLHDGSDPIAPEVVSGLLQKTVMTAAPDALAEQGSRFLETSAGGLSPEQRVSLAANLDHLRAAIRSPGGATIGADGLVAIERRDVVGAKKRNPYVAFYAAGIGVLFLLFTASAASGTLLEDREAGTLDRVLATRVSMSTLLAGRIVYAALLALAQLLVMFTFGALVFDVELAGHLGGFFAMAIPTALACASFGLLLATACRTRAQLGALSTLVILVVSAIGGSMYPRFLMPESLQRLSLFAFNSWALDGFTKVFWREEPVAHLWPQIAFLLANAALFFAIARWLASKWDGA